MSPRSRRDALGVLGGFALLALGCRRSEEPVDPIWGKEPCAHCRMLVGDRRTAAQVLVDGEARYFDDLGCMIAWREAHAAGRPAFVREGERWSPVERVRFASGARTPMDYGFVPQADGAHDYAAVRQSVLARAGEHR